MNVVVQNLFVYGTLRKECDPDTNSRFLSNATFLDYATTRGILLDLGSYPGMIKGEGKVFGEVWQVDQETLEQTDLYESHMFNREKIKAVTNEKELTCWAYFFLGAKIIQSGDYCE